MQNLCHFETFVRHWCYMLTNGKIKVNIWWHNHFVLGLVSRTLCQDNCYYIELHNISKIIYFMGLFQVGIQSKLVVNITIASLYWWHMSKILLQYDSTLQCTDIHLHFKNWKVLIHGCSVIMGLMLGLKVMIGSILTTLHNHAVSWERATHCLLLVSLAPTMDISSALGLHIIGMPKSKISSPIII